jgi:hypothetical protein
MCSASCPRSSLPASTSLPSIGSSGASSPVSTVLSKRYDFLPPVPPRFVAFAWRYLGCTRSVRSSTDECAARGLELVTRCLQPGCYEETAGSPKFLENPDCPFAHVPTDAGRTACTRPIQCSDVAPGHRTAKAPAKGLSTLDSMAFGLAVYASPGSLPRHDARLASGRWSGATGRASTRKVPPKGFRFASYISSSFPKLSWRKRCDRGRQT